MAIKKFKNKTEVSKSDFEGIFIGLNNGDNKAVETIIKAWNFKDIESFLKFAIAIMIKTKDSKRIIIGRDDHLTTVLPDDDLTVS